MPVSQQCCDVIVTRAKAYLSGTWHAGAMDSNLHGTAKTCLLVLLVPHGACAPRVQKRREELAPWVPPWSDSVVALFSTHLFHLRERKALLVAYPSTSATLSVGEWAARWPQEWTRRTVERIPSLVFYERARSSMCVTIPTATVRSMDSP